MGLTKECPSCSGEGLRKFTEVGGYNYVRCLSCGLIFLDKRPSRRRLLDIYSYRVGNKNYESNIALNVFSKIKIFK